MAFPPDVTEIITSDLVIGGNTVSTMEPGTVITSNLTAAQGLPGPNQVLTSTQTDIAGLIKGASGFIATATPDVDYQRPVSLTTSGTSGPATLSGDVLNVPQYAGNLPATFTTDGTVKQTEYNVRDYGAKGDLLNYSDGAITSSSNSFGSSSATFTSADIGKYIEVAGAGAAGATLVTTIAGFTDSHTITLTASAGTTVSGASYWYGTPDDTAMQAAITDCLKTGGTVFVPQGNYSLSTNLLIVGSNLTFRGAGMGAAFLRLQANVNRELIVCGDASTACNNVNFSDFTLDGNYANQTGSTYSGGTKNLLRYRMDSQNGYGGFVERVHAQNGAQNGLSCESMAFGGFVDCVAENMQQNGIWVENGSNWSVINCQTKTNGQNTSIGGAGITFNSFGGFSIIGCNCKGDLGGGIRLINASNGQIVGNSIYRAGWEGSTTYAANGIYMLANNNTLSGNTIYGAYGHGLMVDNCQYNTISANTFRRNGQKTTNTYADIYFTFAGAASNYHNVIANNTFQNDVATFYTNQVAYNINADSPSAHYNNTFIGNIFPAGSDAAASGTVNNMFTGNYWGPNHLGVDPVGTYNYGYFSSSTQTIDPVNGSVIQGTGYNSSVAVTIANGKFVGQEFVFIYNQDVGNKQLTWASNVKWAGGTAPTFLGTASTQDIMRFVWDGTNWNGFWSANQALLNLKLSNPLTTLGDIIYENSTPAPTRLAGNTTTTKKYLSQTGTGSASAAPAWAQPAAADLSDGTTGSGSIVLSTSPSLTTPALGTPSSGTVTNLTGTASININGTVGATTPTTGVFTKSTANLALDSNNSVSVTSNAGTCSASYRLNTFTNSSAATMAITLSTSGVADGQMMVVRVYDFSAAAQTIGWTNTENSTVTAPTTSNGSTTLPLTVGFMYNGSTSKWRCIAVA